MRACWGCVRAPGTPVSWCVAGVRRAASCDCSWRCDPPRVPGLLRPCSGMAGSQCAGLQCQHRGSPRGWSWGWAWRPSRDLPGWRDRRLLIMSRSSPGQPEITGGYTVQIRHNTINSLWPSDIIGLGQHWLGQWLVAWRHQAITWTNVDLPSARSSGIHPK